MNKVLLACTGLCALGGAWFVPWPSAAAAGPTPVRDLFTVQRSDLRVTLTESGTMVAKESKKVSAKVRNESKITWLVEEGKEVQEGEVVVKLDEAPAKKAVEDLQLEMLQTEANLKTARTELEIAEVEAIATVKKAETALDKALKEAEKFRDGEAPQQRRKLEVALKDSETKFARSRKELEDSRKLLEQNFIKRSELEDNELAFESAEVNLESAKTELALYEKYTFPMTVADHATKVADAEREVETAKKRTESQKGQKAVAVQQVEKRLKVQKDQLKERQEELDNMTLKAPCPGIVVYGNPQEPWYRERVKVGNQVYGGHPLVTVPDLRVMQVRLQIHEADISKLKLGQKATVTTDSYPGVKLAGEVTKIATVANSNEDWGGSSEVKKFGVEITIDTAQLQLRPGISAKVEIHIDTREKTLFVPLQSVFAEDGAHWVHVQIGDTTPQRREIRIGTSNDNFMEVLEGLAEGDLVLLYNPLLPDVGTGHERKDADKPADQEKAAPSAAATPTPAPAAKGGS